MEELHEFINEYAKRLTRSIKDLDDIREAMKALDTIKAEFTRIDFTLGTILQRKNKLNCYSCSQFLCTF